VQYFYLVFNICYSIQLRRAELSSKQTTGAVFYLLFNFCHSIQLRRAELLPKQTTGAIYQSIKSAFKM